MENNKQNSELHTPVVFMVYNRPNKTRRVFEKIRGARPTKLFLIADGPKNTSRDKRKVKETRAIIENIDWNCKVYRNYSETNLGCKKRISSGLDWVFDKVKRAIILEDDCVPDPSLFKFHEVLLEKYEDDERIMHISGDNFQFHNPKFKCNNDYFFSRLPNIWGWSTWRRAWKLYDVNIKSWPDIKKQQRIRDIFDDEAVIAKWERKFDNYYKQNVDSWDGQWAYACLFNSGLCIMPKNTLITNIGFGKDASHAKNVKRANLPTTPIHPPLDHPEIILQNKKADNFALKHAFRIKNSYKQRILWFFKINLPPLYKFIRKIYRLFK